MSDEKPKIPGRDIVELVAKNYGFNIKMDSNFNLNEWYGFKNEENKILRAKLVSTADKDGNFNVHKWKNNNELREDFIPYCIIQTHDRYTVIKIKEFDKAAKFVVDENLEIRMGEEDTNISREEFYFDDSIYKIKSINETIYGIKQRVNNKENFDVNEVAIRKLFEENLENICQYCGISQKLINEINEFLIKNNKSPYGLTIRARGQKLEVDQINPKKGYVKGNIALCCYWCNNAKTDTFSIKEFKSIARGINIAWNEKLKEKGSSESICFPENSKIWEKE